MEQNSGAGSAPHSSSGMAPNLAGALCYVLGFITGIVFLMIDKTPSVRFHAFQSILLSVAWLIFSIGWNIVSAILFNIPILGLIAGIVGILVSLLLGLGMFVLVIVLIIKAYQGQQWSLPFIGPMAEKYAAQR